MSGCVGSSSRPMGDERFPTIEDVEGQLRRFDEPPGRNIYETAHHKEKHLERLLGEVRRAGLFTGVPLSSEERLLKNWLERRLERAKEDSQAALLHTVNGLTREEGEALRIEEGLYAEKWARHEKEQEELLRELFGAAGCQMGENGFHPYSGPLTAFVAVHTGTEWEEIRDGALRARAQDQDEGSPTAEARRRLVACIKAHALDILHPPARRAYLKRACYAYRHLHFQFSSDDPDTPGETVLLFPRFVKEVTALLEAEEAGALEQTPPSERAESNARTEQDERLEEYERKIRIAVIGYEKALSGDYDLIGSPGALVEPAKREVAALVSVALHHIDRWTQALGAGTGEAYLEEMRRRYLRLSALSSSWKIKPYVDLLKGVEALLGAFQGGVGRDNETTSGEANLDSRKDREVLPQRSASESPRPRRPALMNREEWIEHVSELHSDPRQIGGPVVASEQPDGVPPDQVVLRGGHLVPRLGLVQEAAFIFEERRRMGEEAVFEFVRAVNKPGGPGQLREQAVYLREARDNARRARDLTFELFMEVEFADDEASGGPSQFRHPISTMAYLEGLGVGKLKGLTLSLQQIVYEHFAAYHLPEDAPPEPLWERVLAFLHAQHAVQHAEWERRKVRLEAVDSVLEAFHSKADGSLWCWKGRDEVLTFWKGDPPEQTDGSAKKSSDAPALAELIASSRRLDYIQDTLIPQYGPEGWGGPTDGSWARVAEALEALYLHHGVPTADWPYRNGGENIHAATLANKIRERERRERGEG